MPRFLALEWNDTEARIAVAWARGDHVVVEQAFSVPLAPERPPHDPAQEASLDFAAGPDGELRSEPPARERPPVDVGRRLASALAARGIGRLDVLVAVGRSNVELRQLSLPPAPDEELPDMVRFQAMKDFSSLGEDWPLDYVPIDDDPGQPRTVLAAAIDPQQVTQIQATCQQAGLKLRRLVLRPCAGASLYWRSQTEGRLRARLLVDLLGDEADLTVVIDRKVIFLRTARLPCDPLTDPEGVNVLVSEIRRTIAAVQNQLGGRKVESVVLFGSGPAHDALVSLMEERLAMPAEPLDPFAGLELQGDLERSLPEHRGRFAPLLGMLQDELRQSGHAVDFLHPRRRPEPPSRRRSYLLAVACAAGLVLAVLGYGMLEWRRLGREQQRIEQELQEKEPEVLLAAAEERAAKEIEAWTAGDVVLLEELGRLSEKLPGAKETMFTSFEFRTLGQGAEMKVEGLARSVETLKEMEEAVTDKSHRVVPKDKGESGKGSYPLRFGSKVVIQAEGRPPGAALSRSGRRR
jgi:Tfp pilus assembly PilM family ATPase